ncbi:spore coat protein [Thermosediminibacter litoriperuensis]|uniref:Spore coat protein n=1 Tax=Thermosediminibacter litoriperuensis TaxID=291989 RepID=A0A5S5AEC5_9FIRM|nr:spore coat protein [Thermosediminibacter litoriperuensis]TYP48173.1 hypothetical protein LZ11_02342 [Thermosediminibacter litoriperuensis]
MKLNLAAHEALEVHEILSLKTLCMQKEISYLDMAKDPDLKDLIKTSLIESRQMITELQQTIG